MPELPDVETFKRYLDATSLHQTIEEVKVSDRKVLGKVSARSLERRLKALKLRSSRRHGKHLLVETDGAPWLTLHFGMTGFLRYFKAMRKRPPYTRLLIGFSNGFHLAYVSMRMLGEVGLAEDPEAFVKDKRLGPDALGLDPSALGRILRGSRASVKSLLMAQERIAGIGNIYSDEILFQAGLHPKTRAHKLGEGQVRKLSDKMQEVMRKAVACHADPERLPASYLLPRRHEGGLCPRCRKALEQAKISGRTAYYCPRCQAERYGDPP